MLFIFPNSVLCHQNKEGNNIGWVAFLIGFRNPIRIKLNIYTVGWLYGFAYTAHNASAKGLQNALFTTMVLP